MCDLPQCHSSHGPCLEHQASSPISKSHAPANISVWIILNTYLPGDLWTELKILTVPLELPVCYDSILISGGGSQQRTRRKSLNQPEGTWSQLDFAQGISLDHLLKVVWMGSSIAFLRCQGWVPSAPSILWWQTHRQKNRVRFPGEEVSTKIICNSSSKDICPILSIFNLAFIYIGIDLWMFNLICGII